jgi:hypothetical protein
MKNMIKLAILASSVVVSGSLWSMEYLGKVVTGDFKIVEGLNSQKGSNLLNKKIKQGRQVWALTFVGELTKEHKKNVIEDTLDTMNKDNTLHRIRFAVKKPELDENLDIRLMTEWKTIFAKKTLGTCNIKKPALSGHYVETMTDNWGGLHISTETIFLVRTNRDENPFYAFISDKLKKGSFTFKQ